MTTDDITYPIVNDDGEVLATNDQERLQELREACAVLTRHEAWKRRANQARERFRLLAREGDDPYVDTELGLVLDIRMGKKGPRQVNPAAIDAHREVLAALNVGPAEAECATCHGTGVREVMPKVTQIDHKDVRPKIARAGINPDTLLIPGAPPVIGYDITDDQEVPW